MTGETFFVKKTNHFERNDIVVFDIFDENQWYDQDEGVLKSNPEWQRWFKRLIALSGDTIQIIKGEVYVNGKHSIDPPTSLSQYDILSKVAIDDFPGREEDWQSGRLEKRGDTFHYTVMLTREQADNYSERKPAILKITKNLSSFSPGDTMLVQPCKTCEWSVDDFGPLKIPARGERIIIDSFNIKLYKNVPDIHFGENMINEQLYFVMGDNRHQSKDSRYVGYISHSKMYGVVK